MKIANHLWLILNVSCLIKDIESRYDIDVKMLYSPN